VTARLLFVVLAVTTFVLDRVTKLLVERSMHLGEHIDVVSGVFELRRVHNPGIAFGMFSGSGSLVVLGSVLVAVLLFYFLLRVEPDDWATLVGGALITGGAAGNLVDRIQHGYVIDFARVPKVPAFQTFNVADVGIVCGVVLVILAQLLASRRAERPSPSAEEGTSHED
jgi:signal peptidase II